MIAALVVAKAFGTLVLAEAEKFLGVPYVGNTLDKDVNNEAVVCREDGLDCVTFMELSLARARAKITGTTVEQEVKTTRYANLEVSYITRNHYTTSWLVNNANAGRINLLFQNNKGAKPAPNQLDFMSTHADKYPQLKAHPEWIPAIQATERELAKTNLKMVPKDRLTSVAKDLRPGDILCFATTVAGLDYSHVALIAGVKSGRVEFWHASSTQKKVVRDPDLAAYAAKQSKCPGFVFARPIAPR